MKIEKVKKPFNLGDQINIITIEGKMSKATVLKCSYMTEEEKIWKITVFVNETQRIQELSFALAKEVVRSTHDYMLSAES